MIGLIKKLLREHLLEAEFDGNGHTIDRIKQRIESIDDKSLSFASKERVLHNLNQIRDVNFDENVDFTVLLGSFVPDPKSDLYVTDIKGRGYYRIEATEGGGILKDSTGDEFWMVIRGNVITTVFLRKSWQTRDLSLNAEKLGVQYTFKKISDAIKEVGKIKRTNNQQPNNQRKKDTEAIVLINGVKWIVNPSEETIYKKNNPNVKHSIEDVMNQVDEPTQEKILSFL